MRPVSVFAQGGSQVEQQVRARLHHQWRQAARVVMVLLSVQGWSPAQIAGLLGYHPSTVRRWISRFNQHGGPPCPTGPAAAVPGWAVPACPAVSRRCCLGRAIAARLAHLPRGAVVMAQDETHLHLLPHIRTSWTLRGYRPKVATPGKNRQVTVYGALNLTGGRWFYRLGRRCAADFIAFGQQLTDAYPRAPKIVVLCDNDSIHHARAVIAYLAEHPRLELLYGARYSPHDNPVERIWAALKAFIANTAVTWPGRLKQAHAFFRTRSPDQMLDTAAPWTSPWLPPDYEQNFWNAA